MRSFYSNSDVVQEKLNLRRRLKAKNVICTNLKVIRISRRQKKHTKSRFYVSNKADGSQRTKQEQQVSVAKSICQFPDTSPKATNK